MKPLEKTLRNKLERTTKDALETAEFAAKAALKQLGIGEKDTAFNKTALFKRQNPSVVSFFVYARS